MKAFAALLLIGLAQAAPQPDSRVITARAEAGYSSNWCGIVLDDGKSDWDSVSATWKVPTLELRSGQSDSTKPKLSSWVGMGGWNSECKNSSLIQAGVSSEIGADGKQTNHVWYEFYPDHEEDFDLEGMCFNTGDSVSVTVSKKSSTDAVVDFENAKTGAKKSITFHNSKGIEICTRSAEWIVEDFTAGSQEVAFAGFDPVTFTSPKARNAATCKDVGLKGNSNAKAYGLERNNKILCTSGVKGDNAVMQSS